MKENKKLILKDGTNLDIEEFSTLEDGVSLTLIDMGYQKTVDTLTQDQVSEVKILNELGETVFTAKGYSLGDSISVNSKENTTKVTLVVKETREAVVDAAKAIQALQNTSEQNTADITAINEAIASLAEIVGGE
nr:MAG TPA: hypothetical protein [Caudoviricetes sp.]DAQ62636.1 MAG TPA: hypothetical protein [Caudoviricetes sp.]